jgi:hypothetical protein
MLAAKPIRHFLVWFVVAISLLIAPWPQLEETYGKLLRTGAQFVFGSFGPKGIVLFRATDETNDWPHDTKIYLGNRDIVKPDGMRPMKVVKMSTRYIGYVPTALVVALVLATPFPWRRRLRSLAWGLVWVHCFIAFLLLIIILHKYNESGATGLYQWSGFPKALVNAAHEVFVGYVGPLFLMPIIIWVAVAFRGGDWAGILMQGKKP